jgi:hypothetical protein
MIRPTRITFLGMLIVLAFPSTSAKAQQQDGRTAQLLEMYKDCVFDAVASQIKSSGAGINGSAATELAFQACRTEEQAILLHALSGGVTPAQADQAVSNYKLSLKQSIRKVLANPEKYARQPPAARQNIPAPPDLVPPRPGCSGDYRRYDGAWVYTNCK